jgi:predicted component of type VI protein secretion system
VTTKKTLMRELAQQLGQVCEDCGHDLPVHLLGIIPNFTHVCACTASYKDVDGVFVREGNQRNPVAEYDAAQKPAPFAASTPITVGTVGDPLPADWPKPDVVKTVKTTAPAPTPEERAASLVGVKMRGVLVAGLFATGWRPADADRVRAAIAKEIRDAVSAALAAKEPG